LSEPDKDVLAFTWDLGDGGRGGSSLLAHVFNSAGSFTVCPTATDQSGANVELGVGISTGKVGVSAGGSLGLGVNAGKLVLAFQGIYANTSGFSASISVIRYP
jgi:PKD repeat protein